MNKDPIESRETVIFCDTDSGGVVSNIAYLRYIEKARCELFASLGMDLPSMNQTGLFPTVVRTEIDYRKPGKLGDTLLTRGWVEKIEKIRIQCRFQVIREESILAEALQMVVLVQMPDGKPVRPPIEWS